MVEILGISKPIIIDWYNHCRQVCKNDNITHHDSHKLGAQIEKLDTGEIPIIKVQLDECLLRGKRLYNWGRMLKDSATLFPLIRSRVYAGAMIWSEQLATYNSLDVKGEFYHRSINHCDNLISATGTHTRKVEQMWSSRKSHIVRNMKRTPEDLLLSHLHEFMWRSWNPLGVYETFERVVTLGSEQYPIQF
ncbi:hypothetical protein RF11_12534 [Thelohanellus kitauei]|uniref:ISXO2-like transposase domain-containing protein n=1 Tax=Thelohanellus kitauei TaxID=669202 RepID=A0A0C2I7T9_THEKT|nr:hypothetical protein RF11_12534 [Thelohanellus kitauei]